MMSEHEDFYRPEHIDEQVDALLQARTMPDQDQRMVQDLRIALTNADADTDAHSLQRVLHQLMEGEHSPHRQHDESISSERMQQQGRVIHMKVAHAKKNRSSITRVFATLAAALIVAVLIGSMLILSHAAQQNNGSGSTITGAPHPSVSLPAQGVYTNNSSAVFRLDIRKKQPLIWQQAVSDVSKIIPAGNVVYILQANQDNTQAKSAVLELDANTGKILWKHAFSNQGSAKPVTMAFAQNRLYVGWRRIINNSYDDGQIDVLNALNGDQLPFIYAHTYAETMDVSNGILAVGNTGLQVYNSTTHKLLWHVSMTGIGNVFSTVISLKIVNNLISVVFSSNTEASGSGKSYIVVYEAATGKQVWHSATFPGDALYHFAIDQNIVYFGSINVNKQPFTGNVYAYNIQSNKQLWSTPVDGGAQELFAISNGTLYTAVDHGRPMSSHLIAIDAATGKIKWQQALDTVVLNSFCMSNGIIYTGRYDGLYSINSSMEAFKADSGQKLWEGAQYGNGNLVPTE